MKWWLRLWTSGHDRQLDRIEATLAAIKSKLEEESLTLTELKAHVTKLESVVASAEALLTNLSQLLKDAIASGNPAAVQALADQLDADAAGLAAAIAANMPSGSPAVIPPPPPPPPPSNI